MNDTDSNRHCWSWRNCFAAAKHKKGKIKRSQHLQTHLERHPSYNLIHEKLLRKLDENSNILSDLSLILNTNDMNNKTSLNEDENSFIGIEKNTNNVYSRIINQNSCSTLKPTRLDVIVEDANEENSEVLNEIRRFSGLFYDSELITNSEDLYVRLLDSSQLNHIILKFNDNGYSFDEFTHHINKLKLKIDDIKRTITEISPDVQLIESRYSTLLATIENLSLILKIVRISSFHSPINKLICSLERRIEQLNTFIQLTSSTNEDQQLQEQEDSNDNDFLSFRSAFSSYEHLLTIS